MKILVGLSGGVDSAVAAYLLKEQGHEVECAFMRNWDSLTNNDILGNPTLDEAICTQEQDYNDAVEVAKKLGLPYIALTSLMSTGMMFFKPSLKNMLAVEHPTRIFYAINTSNSMLSLNSPKSVVLNMLRRVIMLVSNITPIIQKC